MNSSTVDGRHHEKHVEFAKRNLAANRVAKPPMCLEALLCFPATVRKVAIVDIDIHHGNGTQEIVSKFAQPDRIFFFLYLHSEDVCNEKK